MTQFGKVKRIFFKLIYLLLKGGFLIIRKKIASKITKFNIINLVICINIHEASIQDHQIIYHKNE